MSTHEETPNVPMLDRHLSPTLDTPLRDIVQHFEHRILAGQSFAAIIDPAVETMVAHAAPKEHFALQLVNLLQESIPEPGDMELVLRGLLFAIETAQRSGGLNLSSLSYNSSAFLDSLGDLDIAGLRYELAEVITDYLLEREVIDELINHFKDTLSSGKYEKQELVRRAAGVSFMLLERATLDQ